MLGVTTGSNLGVHVFVETLDVALWLLAIARIAWRTSVPWPRGWWSRVAWILVATALIWTVAGVAWPIGPALAIYRTRRRKPEPTVGVPFASGDPSLPTREDDQ